MRASSPRLVLLGVWSLAGAALAYEIVIARWLTMMQWPSVGAALWHLAVLGHAVSGAVLTVFRLPVATGFAAAFAVNALGFGLSCIAGAAAAGVAMADPLDLLTDPGSWPWPILSAGVMALPLFFATNGVVLAMERRFELLAGVYAASLTGSGLAAIAVTAALFALPPGAVLVALALLGVGTGWLCLLAAASRPRWLLTLMILGSLVLLSAIMRVDFAPRVGAQKPSSRWLGLPGAQEVAQRTSPLGWLQVIESPLMPPRHAPGLSLTSRTAVPDQLLVFTDGGNLSVINRVSGAPGSTAYLDELPSALPYQLLAPRPSVLVLGAGGGSVVLQALRYDAARVDAVEPDPLVTDLVRDVFGEYAGHLYDDPRVDLHIADLRGFVRGADARWTLIQLSPAPRSPAVVGPAGGLGGSFEATVEAVVDYLRRLEPGGLLAMSEPARLPPREGVKLFATALAALERLAVAEPAQCLVWVRSWQGAILLIKQGAFSRDEIERIRRFDRRRAFDEAYRPGRKTAATHTHLALTQRFFTEPANALTGPLRGDFLRRYPYRVDPATDDRPYFGDFFRWPLWREASDRKGVGGPSALDLDYPLRGATLLLVVAIAAGLVLWPLRGLRRLPEPVGRRRLAKTAAYFGAIGLSFTLILLVHIERLTLYLGHPIYAVPVVLAGFLVFAGIGSRLAANVPRRTARGRAALAVAGVVACVLLYHELLRPVLERTAGVYLSLKLLLVLGAIAPLALCMGLLLPLGMKRLSYDGVALVPWAFCINRSAAAVGAVLAGLCAMEFGQAAVLWVAVTCYGLAALAVP